MRIVRWIFIRSGRRRRFDPRRPTHVYIVGVPTAHEAIGTSAFTVAVNAAVNLLSHARARTVKWRCVGVFATAGVLGAFGGSTLSKLIDGSRLLALFSVLMLVVAGVMFARRSSTGDATVQLNRENLPKLVASGLATGALSGFFGIGGGFLIVPCLMLTTGMPVMNAIGSSLVAVAAFGATAASNYAVSGFVDWQTAGVFLAGGVFGGLVGGQVAHNLENRRGALNVILAAITVVLYMLERAAASLTD